MINFKRSRQHKSHRLHFTACILLNTHSWLNSIIITIIIISVLGLSLTTVTSNAIDHTHNVCCALIGRLRTALSNELVFDWFKDDWLVELCADKMTRSGSLGHSLAVHNLSLRLSVFLSLLIRLHSIQEVLSATRVLHVLYSYIDSLR